jgi:mono/diheme cytochrome c family protein
MARSRDPLTPLEAAVRRRSIRRWAVGLVVLALLVAAAAWLVQRYASNEPVAYADIVDHFKYGSIGSDIENGLPVRILQVLPRMFPEYLPEGGATDYTAFGLIQEPGHALPIGFSQRRRVIDLAGFNCALCHVGEVRESPDADPQVIPGMPSNTVDLSALFDFLIGSAGDNRFTADNIIAEMEKDGGLFFVDRLIYRLAVPQLQAGLLKAGEQMDRFMLPEHPRFGPGRIDTFNFYKVNQFSEHYPPGSIADQERVGTVDFPSIWNQRPRHGMNLHWDGNNDSVRERNFSAAFGAGATRENVDSASFDRVTAWLEDLPPPPYPFEISTDQDALTRGEALYQERCYSCHGFEGSEVGQVDPIGQIGTDRRRLDSYTETIAEIQHSYGDGYDWDFSHFHKTNGYANHPLDGVWARAPYLHNGSVPTLWDLLTPEEERNGGRNFFYRGHGVYDRDDVGIRTDVEEVGGRKSFRFVISEPGNGNQGHSGPRYGTDLGDEDKRALIEYMKTL